MKRKNYIKIWLLSAVIAGLGAFTSCDNAEYDVLDTHAFIKEALSGTSSKVNVSVDGESKTTLNIHLSDLSTTDNHYKLVVDPSVLDEFNRQNGTSYITLPEGQYILPEDILVKAGEYNAEKTEITLEAFSDEMMKSGESYALPLRLVAKDGALPAMDNTGSFVILAEKNTVNKKNETYYRKQGNSTQPAMSFISTIGKLADQRKCQPLNNKLGNSRKDETDRSNTGTFFDIGRHHTSQRRIRSIIE